MISYAGIKHVFFPNKSKVLLSTGAMCLVINLTVADMLIGLHSVIVLMVDYNPVRCGFLKVCIFSPKILFLMFFVYAFFSLASLTNMTKISIERMHAIFCQLKHRRLKKWVFRATITALWVLPAMVLSMTVFGFDSGSPDRAFYIA